PPVLVLRLRPPPRPTLFPYTTLFRSGRVLVRSVPRSGRFARRHPGAHGTQAHAQDRRDDGVARVGVGGRSVAVLSPGGERGQRTDRKSTRLNSSHVKISYAVFCLKKK